MRAGTIVMVLGIAAAACSKAPDAPKGGGEQDGAADAIAVDAAALDGTAETGKSDSSVNVDAASDVADAKEHCPSPLYPPRDDGCPCQRPGGLPCAELGKICRYYQPCPVRIDRYDCKDVTPHEGETKRIWVASQEHTCPDASTGDASTGG